MIDLRLVIVRHGGGGGERGCGGECGGGRTCSLEKMTFVVIIEWL